MSMLSKMLKKDRPGEARFSLAPMQTLSISIEDEMMERAIEQFGLTSDIRKAGFILSDGRMLNFSGGAPTREFSHIRIKDIDENFLVKTGAMQVDLSDEDSNEFLMGGKPSQRQLDIIKESSGERHVVFRTPLGTEVIQGGLGVAERLTEFLNDTFPEGEVLTPGVIDTKPMSDPINIKGAHSLPLKDETQRNITERQMDSFIGAG